MGTENYMVNKILAEVRLDQLKARLAYRKTQTILSKVEVNLLTTLIGEAELLERSPQGLDMVALVKKFKKNIAETLKVKKTDDLNYESMLLDRYVPPQLTEAKLLSILQCSGAANVGEAMKHLKQNYAGQYDGKLASTVARSRFS